MLMGHIAHLSTLARKKEVSLVVKYRYINGPKLSPWVGGGWKGVNLMNESTLTEEAIAFP